jgi:hypothetical protein
MIDAFRFAGTSGDSVTGLLLDAGTERLRQILLEGAADQPVDAWGDLDANAHLAAPSSTVRMFNVKRPSTGRGALVRRL